MKNNTIKPGDFIDAKLFYDSTISEIPVKKVNERLLENYNLFLLVDKAIEYENMDILEKHFGLKGRKIFDNENWKQVEFKEAKRLFEENKNMTPLKYFDELSKDITNNLKYWEKPEGKTLVKSRVRNLIIFNPDKLNNISLQLGFDRNLNDKNLKMFPKTLVAAEVLGKFIKINLKVDTNENFFAQITYKDTTASYKFNLCVLSVDENIISNIKAIYKINFRQKFISIVSDKELILNPNKSKEIRIILKDKENFLELNEDTRVVISKEENVHFEEEKFIFIEIKYRNTKFLIGITDLGVKPILTTGLKVLRDKLNYGKSFTYLSENKFVMDYFEYFAVEEFRKFLEWEHFIINSKAVFCSFSTNKLLSEEINIPQNLRLSYENIINYFIENKTLPSLCFIDDNLKTLYEIYLNEFLIECDELAQNGKLNDLMKIATIISEDEAIFQTPLHPLNIAYNLELMKNIDNELISDDILIRIGHNNLLPYIYNENRCLYRAFEQKHSPEWKVFLANTTANYIAVRNYIPSLVKDKIVNFKKHFKDIFNKSITYPLLINLINLGDCKEFLQGIFQYYFSEFGKNNSLKMEIKIYNQKNIFNIFEFISSCDDDNIFAEIAEIESKDFLKISEVINLFQSNVKIFSKNLADEVYESCHLCFYKIDSVEELNIYENMDRLDTGISLGGILSGVPSVYIDKSYKTGFGTKFLNINNNLLRLAKILNELYSTQNFLNPYKENVAIATSIMDIKNQKNLDKVYNSSYWVNFIEPKVGLEFFKNKPNTEESLIIHYSDQYTSSMDYDTITVTGKAKQYISTISNLLNEKLNMELAQDKIKISEKIINMFNAINGDWLLKLYSNNNQFPREKISILSAIKICLAYLYHPNIAWVPISLEEILRVSGSIGLKSSEGFFSVKKMGLEGVFCDDLIFVGIEDAENIKLHYLPVEVKIGKNTSSVLDKASEQIKNTAEYFKNNLSKDNETPFSNKIFRNFMIRVILSSIEKMKIYDVWKEFNWDKILLGDIRTKLLSDEYVISDELIPYLGKGMILSFKNSDKEFFRDNILQDDITTLKLLEEDGYSYLNKGIEEIKFKFINGLTDLNKENFIINSYKIPNNLNKITEIKEISKISSSNKVKILFGEDVSTRENIFWYPASSDKTMHTNTGIIGTMGTGKTQFTKALIYQLSKEGINNIGNKPIDILIFDYKGDYIKDDFVLATKAKVYDLYRLPYNPLALFVSDKSKPLLPFHTANIVKDTFSTAFNLGMVQRNTLKEILMKAYSRKGIEKNNKETWGKAAPTMRDIYKILLENEDYKVDSLYSALSEVNDFEIFESENIKTKTLFEIIDGVTVINLSGYSKSIQNLVVAITIDVFYSQMQMSGHSSIYENEREITKMILVDEADNFLSEDFVSLRKILKEGREFGVGTILSTQLLSHFSTANNDYANYIFTWVIHNVTDINTRDIKNIFNTQSKTEEELIFNRIKNLQKHYSIIKIGNSVSPIEIKDKAFWEIKGR